jgi:DNA helicase-2/ATP-dependent DNA helicase PcrA
MSRRLEDLIASLPAPHRDSLTTTLEPFARDPDALEIVLDLLDGLNPEQLEVVIHPADGVPTLILGGAGSGKTATLTRRLVFLLLAGVPAEAIFAVTFTRKAADEMRLRTGRVVSALAARAPAPYGAWLSSLSTSLGDAWISTFHSSGLRILRERPDDSETNLERIGYGAHARVLDERARFSLMADLVRPSSRARTDEIAAAISNAKGAFLYPESYAKDARDGFEAEIADVYAAYHRRMRERGLLDFDDLIFLCHELFTSFPERLAFYQDRFRSLLIDEYQDTNMAQYLFASRLAAGHRRIMAVGDDDQSIYGWRGADVANLARFLSDYGDCRVIRLVRNYRSDASILEAANAIWRTKPDHLRKTLIRERPNADRGEPVRVIEVADAEAEAGYIATEVAIAITGGTPPSEICVLARSHPLLDQTAAMLERASVPARRAGTLRRLASPAVITSLALLDLAALLGRRIASTLGASRTDPAGAPSWRPGDTESLHHALEESLSGPGFALPDEALAGLAAVPDTAALLLEETVRVAHSSRFDRRLANGVDEVARWANEALTDSSAWTPGALLDRAFEFLPPHVFESASDARNPRDELRDLARTFGRFDPTAPSATPAEKILAFTDEARARAGLVADAGEAIEEPEDESSRAEVGVVPGSVAAGLPAGGRTPSGGAVRLMTVHAAKGLEFELVFLAGASDGLLPIRHRDSKDEAAARASREEELRLFYVAVTRARVALHIIHSREREGARGPRSFEPSPFLKLIPRELTLAIKI